MRNHASENLLRDSDIYFKNNAFAFISANLLCVNLRCPKKTRILRSILKEGEDITWRVSDCEELVGVTHRR